MGYIPNASPDMLAFKATADIVQIVNTVFDFERLEVLEKIEPYLLSVMLCQEAGPGFRVYQTLLRELKDEIAYRRKHEDERMIFPSESSKEDSHDE